MTISTPLIIVITIIAFLILPTILMLSIKNKKALLITTIILTCIFSIILIIAVIAKININKSITTLEFSFKNNWFNKKIDLTFAKSIDDLLINLFMLFPIGASIIVFNSHLNHSHPLLKSLLVGFLIGLSIETMQFILPIFRSVQLSDILLNTISTLLGTYYYYFINNIRKRIYEKEIKN